MTRVHYFQRYSQREDTVTNNTLLLLSRLHRHDFTAFESFLQGLFEDTGISVGIEFHQQTGGVAGTRPDGSLKQQPFEVSIEAKLSDSFNAGQLVGHAEKLSRNSQGKAFLLLLSPEEPSNLQDLMDAVRSAPGGHRIMVLWRSFKDIVEQVDGTLAARDDEMREILDDYTAYCNDSGLLPIDRDQVMMAVGCAHSWADNVECSLYYHPRRLGPAGYLGFYREKAVRKIGKLQHVVQADLVNGDLIVGDQAVLGTHERDRIKRAIELAERRGWDIREGHEFHLCEEPLMDTHFEKTSKGGMRRTRTFNFSDNPEIRQPGEELELAEIASRLRLCKWT